ncbi:MAG TPA: tRNA (adenosine(37)-N6)-threonylcarbamoyltransferase complex transferase subunit TsaD [Chitinophagaceae bacterium]|nr:tRNA (adenosine(37)-N6)-threonylcarbamoyltransferase complex transferase subunit TsaD [Chitinophagaceae bacterium]
MPNILAIESSCDETAASVCKDGFISSNIIFSQKIHEQYGGVVPELASRAHLQAIIPVVDEALKEAGITLEEIDAFAFTQAPGLLGSLLVGAGFTKSLSLAFNKPLIGVDHMQGHVLANLIQSSSSQKAKPTFPFLCLTVSGGHTQIILCTDYLKMKVIGQTRDDAAGEAFDKSAKIIGLPYPGGPLIDKYAKGGDPGKYIFPEPKIDGLDFSFSGLKTAILYFIRDEKLKNENFVEENLADICASIQSRIVSILLNKLKKASRDYGIKEICIAGGVSANTELRNAFEKMGNEENWKIFIPAFEYCTDNAAMIAMTAYYKFLAGTFEDYSIVPSARTNIETWSK